MNQKLKTSGNPVLEKHANSPSHLNGKRRSIIFGYGHYAKTVIIPNLHPDIQVAKVHEIDPMQLGPVDHLPLEVDSSPIPRTNEQFDVITQSV